MAEPHFAETHCRSVPAHPLEAYEALQRITLAQMPMTRMLFAMRGLTSPRGLVSDPGQPLLAQMARQGFVVLVDDPGREFAIGAVGQPWQLGSPLRVIPSAESFIAFAEAGFVKMLMGFNFTHGENGTRVETRTLVAATDEVSRRKFRRYWAVVKPGSGLIRRAMLRAMARRLGA